MLVTLSISQWLARVQDYELSKKTIQDFGIQRRDLVRTTKRLLPFKGALAEINQIVSTIRMYHRRMTLPWKEGQGIIRSSKYPEYSKRMRELISKFDTAVRKLDVEFPALKLEAETLLNKSYKEKDYPKGSLTSRYGIKIGVDPIPIGEDWRTDLSEEELEKLRLATKKQEEEKTEKMMEELWGRVYEPIKHMVKVLNKDKPRIFETLISNITNLTEILPDLNLTDDPKLESLRKEIEDKLGDVSAEDLRDSENLRGLTADIAEELRVKIKENGGIEDDEQMH